MKPDGTLTNGRLLIDLNDDKRIGITDGMKVDTQGQHLGVRSRRHLGDLAAGQALGHIALPELVANVEFGDADLKTLYIPARSSVYKMRIKIPGIP